MFLPNKFSVFINSLWFVCLFVFPSFIIRAPSKLALNGLPAFSFHFPSPDAVINPYFKAKRKVVE